MSDNDNKPPMASEISSSNQKYNNDEEQYSFDFPGDIEDNEEEEEENEDHHHRHRSREYRHYTSYNQQQHNNTNGDNKNRQSKEVRVIEPFVYTKVKVLGDKNLKRKFDG